MKDTALLEDALRTYINRRCRRAYAHDLRNGLQGLFGGVDALTRAARATKPLAVPLDQLTSFVQQAITNHERGLERVLDSLAPEPQSPVAVSMRELLMDLAKFLTNDAARNNIRIRQDFSDDLRVTAPPCRLRLLGLALLTESIDAQPSGGETRIAGRTVQGRVQFEIIDSRTQARPSSFIEEAVTGIVAELSGVIESKPGANGGHEVRVQLPAS
ncbi:hypothetical protein JM946_12060 [Steroidobacter sp. S1-65]|uniref:HAMP domain-containing histidine kinase n=1 Tax=Steroidobacter gossypii TaxID=2805490 RepID=A0ABS1WWY6_9GAMM|nr:hypothetical protein [Steroidobacter gossypii]MBM0105490.1 hypothetical protein [Steroidobacter gossypii]